MKNMCLVDYCDREWFTRRGLCKAHYYQERRGRPFTPIKKARRGIEDHDAHFWSFVDKDVNDKGCWKYDGYQEIRGGYIRCAKHPRANSNRSHRVAYFLATGDRAEGLEIDHMCHNPWCCNPDHLRAATSGENGQNIRAGAVRSDSRSGVRNVRLSPNPNAKKPYKVELSKNNKKISFGSFATLAEAEAEAIKQRKIHYPFSQW